MLKRTATRLLLTMFFASVGMVVVGASIPVLSRIAPLSGGCMRAKIAFGMLVGSLLGSLAGCALTIPQPGVSLQRRILSFALAAVIAILGVYAFLPLLDQLPPQCDLASLLALLMAILPALSLLGFSIPAMLSREKRAGWA